MVDENCDEMVHKGLYVMVLNATKKWHLKLRKKVIQPIKRILVARTKTHDEAKKIEEAPIVMNSSPSMEILQHKDITTKDARIPTVTQIGEVIFNKVPSKTLIVGLHDF